MPLIILIASLYLLVIAILMETKNFVSFFLFKALPLGLGIFLGVYAGKLLGWLAFL